MLKATSYLFRITIRKSYCTAVAKTTPAQNILSAISEYNVSDNLTSVFETTPALLDYAPYLWERMLKILCNNGFQASDVIPMIVAYPNLLQCKQKQVERALLLWRNCQFGEQPLQTMLVQAPVLLEVNESNILNRIPKLEVIVGNKKKVSRLLINSPNIIFDSWDHIEQKINYLLENMKVPIHEIIKSSALSLSLSEIRCRHIFLERLGIYEIRKPKSDPNLPSKNPVLNKITDTSEYQFVLNVANVTFEEFIVFKELCNKEFVEDESDFDEDFDIESV